MIDQLERIWRSNSGLFEVISQLSLDETDGKYEQPQSG
jgi:hypothetical protein